ncbi:malectin domain-containing carbohydrate-binding protein [Marinicellulosiphila megalodicopiae]|uniref:malectin domain-containing carbohydrate-binding protein n=1 Tax=Marinicellulosiphila megalodicopiae TaxID=2724896 RepID=UPI003BAFC781
MKYLNNYKPIVKTLAVLFIAFSMASCNDAGPDLKTADRDNDSVNNEVDLCPDVKGSINNNGCPIVILPTDTDNDGLEDALDLCPNEAGVANNNGCPIGVKTDKDNDGIYDEVDSCPNEAGPTSNQGCPVDQTDSDNDGLIDLYDMCPNEYGTLENNGCANNNNFTPSAEIGKQLYDSDKLDCAGCHDKSDSRGTKVLGTPESDIIGSDGNFKCEKTTCSDTSALTTYLEEKMPFGDVSACDNQCSAHIALFIQSFPFQSDMDNDGIVDSLDQCPNQYGESNNNGCPVVALDTDNDGVTDDVDSCPNEFGDANNQGCPIDVTPVDSDNDGIADNIDECPNEIGTSANNGCPGKRAMNAEELAGKDLYTAMCVDCHDEKGDGGRADLRPALKDGSFVGITDLSMPEAPLFDPKSCNAECATKIQGYLLYINNLLDDVVIEPPVEEHELEMVVEVAINAGSKSGFTSTKTGIQFEADKYFVEIDGTGNDNAEREIAGTEDDLLFSSERWGDFKYEIPVQNGEHQVEFWFAELYHDGPDQRQFHVDLEGVRALENFDIFKTTGGQDSAYKTIRFDVVVTDGVLNIDFVKSLANATVNGLVVYREPTMPERYQTSCQGCHGDENGEGSVLGGALVQSDCVVCDTREQLTTYISLKMPFEYAETCVGECAKEFADYIYDNFACYEGRECVDVVKQVPIAGDSQSCSNGIDASFTSLLRISNLQFKNTMRDVFFAQTDYTATFTTDEKLGNFNVNYKDSITEIVLEQYLESMERLTPNAVANMGSWISCASKNDACADKIIDEIGLKLFRRPVTNAEKTRLKAVYTEAKDRSNSFDDGAITLLRAMLASPNFIYQLELDLTATVGNNIVKLGQYEIAARLASFLWRSIPDAALFEAARTNQLATKEGIKAQAERMLADPKADVTISEFHLQWMGSGKVDTVDAHYDEKMAGIGDVKRTIIDLVSNDGSFEDLYTVDYGYLNDAGKAFYDVNGNPIETFDDGFNKYQLSTANRTGILTRGPFLSANHNTPRRGKFIRQAVLCGVIPPAPPGAAGNFEVKAGLSPREAYNLHVSKPSCGGCHKLMDPIGFGFDHFDEVGKWQDQELNKKDQSLWDIDDSGELFATTDINQTFTGADELQALLASSVDTKVCYSYQWFAYANGRTPRIEDACSLSQGIQISQDAGGSILDVIIAITQTDAFSHRRTQSN